MTRPIVQEAKWVFQLSKVRATMEPWSVPWKSELKVWRVAGISVPANLHPEEDGSFVFQAATQEIALQFVSNLVSLEVEYQRAIEEAHGIWASQFHTAHDLLCSGKLEIAGE